MIPALTDSRNLIMVELAHQGHDRMWLSREVVTYTTALRNEHKMKFGRRKDYTPLRFVSNPETVMRFLRAETEGGAYLIDACFNVLGLTVVPEIRRPKAKVFARRKKKRRHHRVLQKT